MLSPAARSAIKGAHTVTSRVELWYGGSPVDRDLPVVDGSVRGQRSLVRRTLDVTLAGDRDLWDALTKPGMELKAFRGAQFPDGSVEESPIGVFLASRRPQLDVASGAISLSGCPDLFQRVIDARFETPRTSRTAFTYFQQIESLVREVVPRLFARDELRNGNAMPNAVWDRDRGAAVSQVATAAGGEVWFDPAGVLVLGRPPTFADRAAIRLTDRDGTISTASVSVDYEAAYNIVVASGERTDGTPPVVGIARDTGETSVTRWNGPMGPKPRFYSSPLLLSATSARAAAETLLTKSVGAARSITVEAVANPDIDVASRVDVTLASVGVHERHIVDSFTLPLFSAGMTLETRAVDLVEVDGG